MAEQLLMRPKEAADALGVSRSKCYAMMAAGELPVVRVGRAGSRRIPVEALRAWVRRRTRIGARREWCEARTTVERSSRFEKRVD
jgi:excisionase family DNA binding protein